MKNIRLSLMIFTSAFFISTLLQAEPKRTDGPAGSEYGDFSHWDGQFQMGLHFGAGIPQGASNDTSFDLGLDLDFKPYDIFGFRAGLYQGLNSPRSTIISLTPLIHTDFSNLKPYLLFGPGIGFFKAASDNTTKFLVSLGGGADVLITDSISFGMLYMYSIVFDLSDQHTVTARLAYAF